MITKSIPKVSQPPGDFAIWIIIYVELVTFAALFIGYAFARRADVELFNQSQLLLDQRSGFSNTLYLFVGWLELVNSLFVSILLITTFIKGRLVSEYFMGLKNVTLKYKMIPTIWLFIVLSSIAIAYYLPISN